MTQPEAPLAISTVEEWKKTACQYSIQSDDAFISIATNVFDSLSVILKTSDQNDIQRVLKSLNSERSICQSSEKTNEPSVRYLMYGLIQSLHLTLVHITGKSKEHHENSISIIGEWKTMACVFSMRSIDSLVRVILKGFDVMSNILKNSDNLNIQRALKSLENERSICLSYEKTDEPSIRSLMFGIVECLHLTLLYLTEKKSESASTKEISKQSNEKELKEEPNDSQEDRDDDQMSTLCVVGGDMRVKEEKEMLNENIEEQHRKTPSEPDLTIKSAIDELFQSESTVKKKYSDTEMNCPACEFRTNSARTWFNHLKMKHRTRPNLAGVSLLCECGIECESAKHSYKCHIANFVVIRKRDGPIRTIDDAKTTPQCILCEVYPRTAYGYSIHLARHHQSTLIENGIFLLCACGAEVRYKHAHPRAQSVKCKSLEFSLHKIDELTKELDGGGDEENGQENEREKVEEKERSERSKEKKKKKKKEEVEKIYRSIMEIMEGENEISVGSIYRRIRKVTSIKTPLSVWKRLLRKFETSEDGEKEGYNLLKVFYPSTQDVNEKTREKAYRKLTRCIARRIRDAKANISNRQLNVF